jgi:hypothetical protein
VIEVMQAVRSLGPEVVVFVGGRRQADVPDPAVPLGHRMGDAAHALARRVGFAG